MPAAHLALVWHQHQPYYPDDLTGEIPLPWTRLHGTKDYYGMAMHLREVPEFRCTINLVPSLLLQIEQYVAGREDAHLTLSRRPADGLTAAETTAAVELFFLAHAETMIRPHPRYQELYLKRGFGTDTAENAARRFTPRDLRDLQVWGNLTWFHELAFEADADLAAFRAQGRGWTEAEKHWLLDKQREILAQIIPLHRELAATGQVELTTTPFYHPILPLLFDKRDAREAMPRCDLPRHLESYAEDAREHLARAVAYHERLFGERPVGMWPSEGSVSLPTLVAIADAGLGWIATDEEILSASTDGRVARDGGGHLRNAELLYRPWEAAAEGRTLQMVFRDHALSDLIGFHYQRSDPDQAAADLLGRVAAIGEAVGGQRGDAPLVPTILDGENCWEYYPDGGVRFLRSLYRQAANHPHVRPVRVRDHLERYPATDRLPRLAAGSWINHNFAIWIGHQEDNDGWDRLHETRDFLVSRQADAPAGAVARAWDELYIAQGSDWFWWYGDDHSSPQDALFDRLFRTHLRNVYTLLGESPPAILHRPISRGTPRATHTQPTDLLDVTVDGRRTWFEWLGAGRYVAGNDRGTMALVTAGLFREIHFGFGSDALFLRIDTAADAVADLAAVEEIRVRFQEPPGREVRVTGWQMGRSVATLHRDTGDACQPQRAAVGRLVEIAVSLGDLGVGPGDPVQFAVEVLSGSASLDRAPREGVIELRVPTADFAGRMWFV